MSIVRLFRAGAGAHRGARTLPVRVPPVGQRPYPPARIPDSSVAAVAAVAKVDGRTTVRAWRAPGGTWYRSNRRTAFTPGAIARLREAGVAEVVLRRRTRAVAVPLIWLP
jgi:hypothetical protein